MPRYVVRVDRDSDRYVYWSSVVDAPVSDVMTAVEMVAYLARLDQAEGTSSDPVGRVCRARTHGTSAQSPRADSPRASYGFDSGPIMVEQRGLLPRARLGAFLDLYGRGDVDGAYALLDPLDR